MIAIDLCFIVLFDSISVHMKISLKKGEISIFRAAAFIVAAKTL